MGGVATVEKFLNIPKGKNKNKSSSNPLEESEVGLSWGPS
jgi:hypothetical protein